MNHGGLATRDKYGKLTWVIRPSNGRFPENCNGAQDVALGANEEITEMAEEEFVLLLLAL